MKLCDGAGAAIISPPVLMLDLDGVLIRGRAGDGSLWTTDLERDLGVPVAALQDVFFRPYWDAIVTGELELISCLERCLPDIAPRVAARDLIAYWFSRDAYIDHTLLEKVDRIRAQGGQVYLATNQEHLRIQYVLDELGVRSHVDGCFHSASLGYAKPSAGFYDSVYARVGVARSRLLLIDDNLENIRAALAARWRAIWWQGDPGVLDCLEEGPI
jgi:putative hydrolase of the HAD superfamily